MPHKVTIDRPNCIADGSCQAACPEVFELSDEDGLAQITQKYRENPEKLGVGEIPDEMVDCAETAADVCPVSIISVEEV